MAKRNLVVIPLPSVDNFFWKDHTDVFETHSYVTFLYGEMNYLNSLPKYIKKQLKDISYSEKHYYVVLRIIDEKKWFLHRIKHGV